MGSSPPDSAADSVSVWAKMAIPESHSFPSQDGAAAVDDSKGFFCLALHAFISFVLPVLPTRQVAAPSHLRRIRLEKWESFAQLLYLLSASIMTQMLASESTSASTRPLRLLVNTVVCAIYSHQIVLNLYRVPTYASYSSMIQYWV